MIFNAEKVPTFSYAEIETVLAKVFDAEDVQKTAFRGRLKHFRKLGLPAQRPGKGSRIRYTESYLHQLMVACELSEFGLDPKLIADIVRWHWSAKGRLADSIKWGRQSPNADFYVTLEARIMSWAWNKEKSKRTATEIGESVWLEIFQAGDVNTKAFLDEVRTGRRFFIFNLSQRIREVGSLIKNQRRGVRRVL